jgi:hypothetical protein
MRTLTVSSLMLVGLGLAGCTDRLLEPPPLGAANAQNKAAQIVDPVPEPTDVAPPLNGERNNAAQTRYEKGKVIKPADIKTSSQTGSGGGSQ